MKDLAKLLLLPITLTGILVECAEVDQWPYNLPRNVKYFPEDEPHVKRGLEVQERLQWQAPRAVRKMSDDPGAKFFLDYWDFGEQPAPDNVAMLGSYSVRKPILDEDATTFANGTRTCLLHAPFQQHTNQDRVLLHSILGRSVNKRDFKCPSGTNSCSNIDSNLCCQSDETCVTTDDGVGCCPNGASCGQSVADCNTGAGYTSCPDSDNGGCCVPGAQCLGIGCVFYGTQTVTATASEVTVTIGTYNPTTATQSHAQGTTVIVAGEGSTTTVTITEKGRTVTTTVISPTTIIISPSSSSITCTEDYFSCPASLGGGCCRNGQACATGTECPDITTTTTATANQPVRPTSNAGTNTITSQTSSATPITDGCPTGFYMCSAVYLGGCCRVDRNCDSTSCPSSDSTAVVTSGLTIAAGASATGSCQSAWSSCADYEGGGCCPPGYACGTQCSASNGGATTAKQMVSAGAILGAELYAWSFAVLGVCAGFGMIWL